MRRRRSLLQHSANKRHGNYSRNKKDLKFFAPALTQRLDSSITLFSKTCGGALLCLNTLALRSFQITHETNMVIEAFAFRLVVPTALMLAHHDLTKLKELHADVSMSCMRNF